MGKTRDLEGRGEEDALDLPRDGVSSSTGEGRGVSVPLLGSVHGRCR